MKRLANTGPSGEPIATPSTWSKSLPSKRKCVCLVAKMNNCFRSFLSNLTCLFSLKMVSTASSMVSSSGTFVNRLFTSKDTKNEEQLLLTFLMSSTNVNVSVAQCLDGK